MKRHFLLLIIGAALTVSLATTACDSDDGGDSKCCPVSETFVCSDFKAGGARSQQKYGCSEGITDNIAVSIKQVDSEGCTYWAPDPAANGARTCGVAPPRPTVDASTKADASTTSDASTIGDGSADASDAAAQ